MEINKFVSGEINFRPGDTVCVYQKIQEGPSAGHSARAQAEGSGQAKARLQVFEGVVLGIRGRGANKSFMVRKIASGGIGVERIWPLSSPMIEKIVVKKKPKKRPRRAKLYYLRRKK